MISGLLFLIVFLAEIDVERLAGLRADQLRDVVLGLLIVALAAPIVRRRNLAVDVARPPVAGLVLLFGAGMALSPLSVTPTNSFLRSGIAAVLVVGVVVAVDSLGLSRTLRVVGAALAAVVVASLVWEVLGSATPLDPNTGRPDTGLFGLTRRIGLTGSSNELGRASTILFAIGIAADPLHRTRFGSVLRLIGIAGALAAQSRTALAILVLVLFLDVVRRGRWRALATTVWLGTLAGLTASVSGLLRVDLVTREGEGTRELATATGRTGLWEHVIELIPQRPIIGSGAFSAEEVLAPGVENQLIFDAADAHNTILNIVLTQGLVGLLLFGVVVVPFLSARTRQAARRCHVGLLLIALVGLGTTENLIRKPSISLITASVALVGITALLRPRERTPARPAVDLSHT